MASFSKDSRFYSCGWIDNRNVALCCTVGRLWGEMTFISIVKKRKKRGWAIFKPVEGVTAVFAIRLTSRTSSVSSTKYASSLQNHFGVTFTRCIFILFHSRCKCLKVPIQAWYNCIRHVKQPVVHSASLSKESFCTVRFYWHSDARGRRRRSLRPRVATATLMQQHSHCSFNGKVFKDFEYDVGKSSFHVFLQSVVDSWYELLKTLMGFFSFFFLTLFSSGSS